MDSGARDAARPGRKRDVDEDLLWTLLWKEVADAFANALEIKDVEKAHTIWSDAAEAFLTRCSQIIRYWNMK